MHRFITNRWWTFILALVLGLGCLFLLPSHSSYAASTGTVLGSGDQSGGSSPPIPGNGDPDYPIGSTKCPKAGVQSPTVGSYGMQAAGDSRVVGSALMWRLRVVMLVLRSFYLRW